MVQTRTSTGGIRQVPDLPGRREVDHMATPDAVAEGRAPGTPPGQVIAALEGPGQGVRGSEPPRGSSAPWASSATPIRRSGRSDKAPRGLQRDRPALPGAASTRISHKASRAEVSFNQGKVDEALATVQPIVDAANKDLAPSPDRRRGLRQGVPRLRSRAGIPEAVPAGAGGLPHGDYDVLPEPEPRRRGRPLRQGPSD